ncbi:MAG: DUF3046 domain-containing protein [Candidatus Nanopelagicales bacterium]
MRLTDFWERMDAVFGVGYARSWAHDHVLAGLGGRTVTQALADGEPAKDVWRAVCEVADVPAVLR